MTPRPFPPFAVSPMKDLPTTAWSALDRLLNEMPDCDRTEQQLRLLLESVREGARADVVFLFSPVPGPALNCVGEPILTATWCRDFTRRLLEETPGVEGQLLRATLPPVKGPLHPYSAALVRVSKSNGTWIVALRFRAEPFRPDDVQLIALARRLLNQQRHHVQAYDRLKETWLGLVRCLTATIDAKDPFTLGHSERVARIAVRLGRQLRLGEGLLSDLYLGGLLHDIGKIGLRDDILQKPGPLTAEEFEIIKQHPVIGDEILANIPQLNHLRAAVRSHHEHYDGTGYPDGLAGHDIPLLARLLAVADACDAMMSARPYRPGLLQTRIDQILAEGAGRQWDPDVIRAFQSCHPEPYTICQQGLGPSVCRAVEQVLKTVKAGSAYSLCLPAENAGDERTDISRSRHRL